MKFHFAALLSFVSAAFAVTDGPYSIGAADSGIEKGILNTTISCQVSAIILPLGNYNIGLGVYATLPNKVNANQPFNLVAATRLITPANLNGLAAGFGARTYGGKATKVEVRASGSNPAVVDAAKNNNLTIPRAPVNAKGVSILELPGNGNTITVGPFKGANTTGTSDIIFSFGAIEATVNTFDDAGKQTFITASIKCPAAQRPTSLAFITAGGQGSTTTVTPKADGIIKTIPADSTAGVVGLTYDCDFSGFVQGKIRISVGGVKKTNKAVASGSKISLSQGQGNVYLSQDLINEITSRFDAATQFSVDLTTLNFLAKNASPAKLNGIQNTYVSPISPLSTDTVLTVPADAPASTLPDITFTAGKSGSTALISLGDAAGVAHIYDSDGNEIFNIEFTCPALNPATALLPYDIA